MWPTRAYTLQLMKTHEEGNGSITFIHAATTQNIWIGRKMQMQQCTAVNSHSGDVLHPSG